MKNKHQHGGKSSEGFLDKNIILNSLDILPGQNILDAGCGNGYMSREFAKLVANQGRVYAMDIHRASIETLQSENELTNIEVIFGDVTQENVIENASIDLMYLSNVFHGFDDAQVEGFLSQAKRILKSSGALAIVEINKNETPFGPPMDLRFSPEQLAQRVALRVEKVVQIGDHFYMEIFGK